MPLFVIEGLGTVLATPIQWYPDGDVRVSYAGRQYIAKVAA